MPDALHSPFGPTRTTLTQLSNRRTKNSRHVGPGIGRLVVENRRLNIQVRLRKFQGCNPLACGHLAAATADAKWSAEIVAMLVCGTVMLFGQDCSFSTALNEMPKPGVIARKARQSEKIQVKY